jgi:hypothetical protein
MQIIKRGSTNRPAVCVAARPLRTRVDAFRRPTLTEEAFALVLNFLFFAIVNYFLIGQ